MNEELQKSMNVLFLISYTIAKGDLSFNDFTSLCALQKKLGHNLGETYINNQAAKVFVSYIAKDIQNELVNKINESNFLSIMSDASTDKSASEGEIVYVQYIDGLEAKVSFLGLQPLLKADASGTLQAIETMMDCKGIKNWKERLVSCCFDGASVNMGSVNGIATRLKNEVSGLIVVHCINHRLELALNDACKEVKYLNIFEDVIKGLYKLYNKSPKLQRNVKEVADFLDDKFVKCRPINNIIWIMSKHRAVSALCKNFHIICIHLLDISEDENELSKLRSNARGFLKHLRSERFVKFLFFMCDLSKLLCDTSVFLQKEKLVLHQGLNEINACLSRIQNLLNSNGVSEIELNGSLIEGEFRSIKLTSQEKRNELGCFEEDRNKLLTAIKNYIEQRVTSVNDSIAIPLAKILNPSNFPDNSDIAGYGCDELLNVYSLLPQTVLNSVSKDELLTQYCRLKMYTASILSTGNRLTHESLFSRLYAEDRDTHFYSDILKLMEIMQLIPCSTAACERGFSAMNRIKTCFRSSLAPDSVNDLMMIRCNGVSIEEYQPINAIKMWWKDTSDGKIRHCSYKR